MYKKSVIHVQSCCFANHANLFPNGLYGEGSARKGYLVQASGILKGSGFHLLKYMKG